jgi:hypothetical protein
LLHQFQRIIVHANNGEAYVIGTIDDLKVTLKIMSLLIESTTTGLRVDVLDAFNNFFKKHCPSLKPLTVNQLLEEWPRQFGRTIARSTLIESYLQPLYNAGLLNKDESTKAHKYEVSHLSEVSGTVGFDADTFAKTENLASGLEAQLLDLFTSVGVSEVTQGGVSLSIGDRDSVIEKIVDSVYVPTVRQMFIDKLSEPLASCLKNEEKISVGSPLTHADTPDRSSPAKGSPTLSEKVAGACEDWKNGMSLQDIEHRRGVEAVKHCKAKGLIPVVGGRVAPFAWAEGRK